MKTQTRIELAMVLALALLGGLAPRAEAAGYQMPITFSGYTNRSEALTNFPVLVVLSNGVGSSGFSFADMPFATTNGYDLRFYTNTTDTNSLDYEIESWNTNATSYVWVRVPLIPTNGTGSILATWGDEANSTQFPCTTNGAVWTNGYEGVWHLATTNGVLSTRDSTTKRAAGAASGSPAAVDGKIDGAVSFPTTSDRINLGNVAIPTNNGTVAFWWQPLDLTSANRPLFDSRKSGSQLFDLQLWTDAKFYAGWYNSGEKRIAWTWSGITTGNWYYVSLTWINGGTTELRIDGQSKGTTSGLNRTWDTSATALYLNYDAFSSASGNKLYLDEVTLSSQTRSTNWIWACYINQASNTTFSNYGAVERLPTYKLPMAFTNYTRAEVLTNFPVLVTFSNGLYGTFNYNTFTAPATGGDLRFMDSTESTYLDFEIEKWTTNDASYAWVRVPLLSSNTTIYAKWGGSDTTLPACTTNGAVWTNGFVGVWHYTNGVALNLNDSSLITAVGSVAGSPVPTAGTGVVDGAANINNGTSGTGYISEPYVASHNLNGSFAVEVWFKRNSYRNGSWPGIMGTTAWKTTSGGGWGLWYQASDAGFYFLKQNQNTLIGTTSSTAFDCFVVSYNGSSLVGYRDGTQTVNNATTFTTDNNTAALNMGVSPDSLYGDFIIDEFRISSMARSANWVWAEYANMASNAFFNGYGTVIAPTTATTPPRIQNQAPTGVMTNGATFNGKLVTNGFENAAVYVAWGQTNGAVSGSWATTNWWNPGDWTNGSYPATNLTLAANANYYYRFGATNSMTNVVASGYQYLITGEVTVQPTDPTGRVTLADTAAFTVYRPASCTNEALTVAYTLGGSATNGTHYTNSPAVSGTNGTVTLAAGQTNAVVTVYPLNATAPEQTVVLSLASGNYAIGSANSATGTLAAATAWVAGSNRYWVAAGPGNWNNTNNWSFAPYGPGGWSVPASTNVAIFDGSGAGNCTMDTAVNVAGIVLTNGYAGTVTQGTVAITVGASGWTQAGGTFSGGTNTITLNGSWSLSGGTFNAGNQTITMNNAGPAVNWVCSGGMFNAGSSTVSFFPDWNGITISGSQTFNNLTLNGVGATHVGTVTIPAGTTLTVTNTLLLYDGSSGNVGVKFAETGTIAAQGNIAATYMRANNAYYGTVLLLINGAGDQTFTNAGATLSRIEINKPNGTLSLAGTHVVGGGNSDSASWTYTAGALNAGASTITFYGENGGLTISGSHTLGNVSFVNVGSTHGNTITIASGTTLTAAGTLTFNAASGNSAIPINTGTLNAQGDVNFSMGAVCNGSAAFGFTGAATQQVSYAGTLNNFRLTPVTVNKTGGAVTLATDLGLGTAGQQVVWTNGAVNLSSNTLTVAGATTIYPGATTLGVSVVDSNKAGRLACSSAVSSITNVTLAMTVAATEAQLSGQTYMVLTNTAALSSPFESVSWPGLWVGDVSYASSGGKAVTIGNIRQQALGGAPTIVNQPVTAVTSGGATFNGRLISNGTYSATVFVLWGETNGAVSGSWASTNSWNQGDWPDNSYPSTNLTLSGSRNYYYAFGAVNSGGQTIAPDQQYLITGDLTVQATDPTGRGPGNDTAAFTVYRPANCTNEALAVNYTLGGTAAYPADYTIGPVSGAVILAKGQTNGVITVTPVFKESLAQTVVLTLAPGAYATGTQNSATSTLATVAGTNRYWVASAPGNWSDTNNWSFLTGQPGGWSVPGSGSIAFFDSGGSGNCAMDMAVNVAGIRLTNGYAGAVTQGTVAITVGSNGWSQSAGTFTGSTNTVNLNGPWSLAGGTFNAGNQTIGVGNAAGSWTYSGGTFNAGSSTVSLWADNSTITISGSQTFNNLTMNGVYQTHWSTYTVPTGTTLTVTNTLSLRDNDPGNVGFGFGGTGTIAAKGNITASYLRANNAYFGTVLLLINGTGDQTFTNAGAAMSRIEINKPGGTLSLTGTHRVGAGYSDSGYWTYTAGTLNAGGSTITFFSDNGGLIISGSHTLGNVTFVNIGPTHANNMTIAAGTTLSVAGTLAFDAFSGGSSIPINTGTLNAQGDVNFSMGAPCGGTAAFTFTGAATQQVSYAGTPNYCQFSPITVNKTGGALTLATDLSLGNAGQQLVWTNGAVNLSSNTLTVAGAVTIHPGATTLGVTVADATKAGRLACSSAVSSITNVGLDVNVNTNLAPTALSGQEFVVVTNAAALAGAFDAVQWNSPWNGRVVYNSPAGTVKLVHIGVPAGTIFLFR